jgi:hypothetical protein
VPNPGLSFVGVTELWHCLWNMKMIDVKKGKKGKKAEMVYNEMLKENQILAAVILQNL